MYMFIYVYIYNYNYKKNYAYLYMCVYVYSVYIRQGEVSLSSFYVFFYAFSAFVRPFLFEPVGCRHVTSLAVASTFFL